MCICLCSVLFVHSEHKCSDGQLAMIFSHSVGFMLTWLIVSLYIQKTLSFVRLQLLIVNLNFWANWVLLRKSFPTPASCQVLNTNIKHPEKDIMDTLWHTVTSQKMKYLIMNLTMEVKLLYNTNFKSVTLGKTLRNWNMPHAHGLVGWVNILKMTILPKIFIDSVKLQLDTLSHSSQK